MKAVAIAEFGGRDKLQVMDLPAPEPGEGELLIRVKAAGVNPVDWKIREGLLRDRIPHRFPVILGWDAAGVVAAPGPGARRFLEGDDVYAYCRKPVVQGGAYAQYVAVPETSVARKPKNMSYEEAATVPLAALTAYQSLMDAAGLTSNDTVLIHAAAGGVGSFAVQLAKNAGCTVLGTAGTRNHDYLRSLGCDHPVDYTAADFRAAVRQLAPDGVDVVFDCVGGEVTARSAEVLKPGGRLVSICNPAAAETLKAAGIRAHYVFVAPNGEQLARLTRVIEGDCLATHIAGAMPLGKAARAHELIEGGHIRGKLVLTV